MKKEYTGLIIFIIFIVSSVILGVNAFVAEKQRERFQEISLIESVLIRHNLITNEEANQARREREEEADQSNNGVSSND